MAVDREVGLQPQRPSNIAPFFIFLQAFLLYSLRLWWEAVILTWYLWVCPIDGWTLSIFRYQIVPKSICKWKCVASRTKISSEMIAKIQAEWGFVVNWDLPLFIIGEMGGISWIVTGYLSHLKVFLSRSMNKSRDIFTSPFTSFPRFWPRAMRQWAWTFYKLENVHLI